MDRRCAELEKAEYPSRLADQYMVRFPEGLRETFKKMAKQNMRSMNSEIVMALQAWTERQNEKTDQAVQG